MYYLASIRFCDKNCHSPRGNNYIYIIDNSIYDKIVFALKNNYTMFKIINNSGYNYRNSDIVFDCFYPINYSDDEIEIILKQTSYKQIIEISENYELSYGRYKVGVGDPIELKEAQVQYQNAMLTYYQTMYEYNTARANLEKSIGKNISNDEVQLDCGKTKKKKAKNS